MKTNQKLLYILETVSDITGWNYHAQTSGISCPGIRLRVGVDWHFRLHCMSLTGWCPEKNKLNPNTHYLFSYSKTYFQPNVSQNRFYWLVVAPNYENVHISFQFMIKPNPWSSNWPCCAQSVHLNVKPSIFPFLPIPKSRWILLLGVHRYLLVFYLSPNMLSIAFQVLCPW